jgi:argininosuccinate lyase
MQRAQPVLLSHHLLAYIEMLERDKSRASDASQRMNLSPLGAAAFAGTSYPIDRKSVANELGFDGIVQNSIDAVSDRDCVIDLASLCSIAMMHLSRMAEELVLWSTKEFGFVTMSDAVTTGSSIMPQKKNPDMAELVRGKTGRVYGALINLLTIMKGLPLAYNRDMQEDKEPMFAAVDTTISSLEIMAAVIHQTTFNTPVMESSTAHDHLTATEIADYLARKGIPFRDAHHITGQLVAYADQEQLSLDQIPLAVLRQYSNSFEEDVYNFLNARRSIEMKQSAGSTAPQLVEQQILRWREQLSH